MCCLAGTLARADDLPAVAELIVNNQSHGDTLMVLMDGVPWIPIEALASAGVDRSGGIEREIDGRTFVSLDSLSPDVTYAFDDLDGVIRLQVRPERFGSQVVMLSPSRPADMVRVRNASGFLNYAVTAGRGRPAVATEAVFNIHNFLGQAIASRDARGQWWRGPVHVTFDEERRLRRWEAGDTALVGGVFGSVVPIAGVSVSREFGIDPYFVQYMPLALTGATDTAAVAEVYVNGQLVRRVPLAAGAFAIRDLPVSVGAGQADVVIRDSFGREQRFGRSFYTPASILRPGLQQYRYSVGVMRSSDLSAWRYSGVAGVGEHRIGLTDALTVGGRVEASEHLAGLSSTIAMRLPVGELELLAAGSRAADRTGGAGLVAWTYRGRIVTGNLFVRGATRHYRVLTVTPDPAPLKLDAQASIGWSAYGRLSFAAYQARLHDWLGARNDRTLISASWQALARANIFASVARVSRRGPRHPIDGLGPFPIDGPTDRGRRVEHEAFLGINIFLGERLAAGAGVRSGRRTETTVFAQRSLPVGPGYAYHVQWQPGDGDASLLAQYQGAMGRVEVRSDRFNGESTTTGAVMGAVAMLDGRVYLTRPIDDAFGVVRVSDVGGVGVYSSNQYMGRTNKRGDVIVPNLVSYYGNRLSIAPEDMPLLSDVGASERVVAPSLRGGALVPFEARTIRPVVGRLVVRTGPGAVRVPAYGEVRVRDGATLTRSPIGSDGAFYFERLRPGRHRLVVTWKGVAYECLASVPLASIHGATADEQWVNLGTVDCVTAFSDVESKP